MSNALGLETGPQVRLGPSHRKGFEKQTSALSKGFEMNINMYTQRCWKTSDPTLLEEGPGLSPLLASVLYMS